MAASYLSPFFVNLQEGNRDVILEEANKWIFNKKHWFDDRGDLATLKHDK